MMYGWGWGGWLVMWVVMLIFSGGLIAAGVVAVRYLTAPQVSAAAPVAQTGRRGPDDILADRYARGEIDDEEFRRRMALLREHRAQ